MPRPTTRRKKPAKSTPSIEPPEFKRRAAGSRTLGVIVLMLVALCACDVGRRPDAIPECAAYAASAQVCLGSRVTARLRASFAKVPEDAASQAAMKARCIDGNARLRLSCR